jgi:hypothetical protein
MRVFDARHGAVVPRCPAMRERLRFWPVMLGMLAVLCGCEAIVHPDVGSLGATPVVCTPGQTVISPCLGGGTCNQICNAGGSYDPCVCAPSQGAAGAGH